MPRLLEAKKDVISCGDWHIRIDPQISEWGNPLDWRSSISQERSTRGTETSQYPQEKKTKVIPLVVASERGVAQTADVSASTGL